MMNRNEALVASAAFFVIAPGTIAGVIPWLITHWRFGADAAPSLIWTGAILIVLAAAALVSCFLRFAAAGGTPAPVAPAPRLVVEGLYRHVRNPMYLAVSTLIFAQALIFASAALIAYGMAVFTAFVLFVVFYEEPRLRADFPEDYPAYFANVPRWFPRLTPWRPAPAEKIASGDA
jgi:protein-S-isoprenylcysteine O-methyltransferase Ste14